MEEQSIQICDRCLVEPEESQVRFQYLGRAFRHKVPRCPRCGQNFLLEEVAEG